MSERKREREGGKREKEEREKERDEREMLGGRTRNGERQTERLCQLNTQVMLEGHPFTCGCSHMHGYTYHVDMGSMILTMSA